MSFCDLALLFDRFGFRIECTAPVDDTQVLMRDPSDGVAHADRGLQRCRDLGRWRGGGISRRGSVLT